VYGKIAPQTKFSKMDPTQGPRSGGAEQVITDGGYSAGAVTNRDQKYPTLTSSDYQKRAQEYENSHTIENAADDRKSSHIKSNSNGQFM